MHILQHHSLVHDNNFFGSFDNALLSTAKPRRLGLCVHEDGCRMVLRDRVLSLVWQSCAPLKIGLDLHGVSSKGTFNLLVEVGVAVINEVDVLVSMHSSPAAVTAVSAPAATLGTISGHKTSTLTEDAAVTRAACIMQPKGSILGQPGDTTTCPPTQQL